MNSVERARYEMLVALVVEAAKGTSSVPDVEELAIRHNVKVSPIIAKSSLQAWEEKGFLIISRLLDGTVAAAIKPSRYADALDEVLQYLGATEFSVSWPKEEIITDADEAIEFPIQEGWKILYFENAAHKAGDESSHAIERTSLPTVDLPKRPSIDWSKWGAIAGIVALPLAILLAWLFA